MNPIKIIRWLIALTALSILTGSAAAFFLWSLDAVTHIRFSNNWLLFLLPIFGIATGFYYRHHGNSVNSANHLILASSKNPHAHRIPRRLAPSILFATLGTHLFGGSAGREGTAIQMGAGIASSLQKIIPKSHNSTQLLLLCGIAAGFGAVFATPIAGAIFALEFIRRRIISPKIIPCILTAFAAHHICLAWGAHHTAYPTINLPASFSSWLSISWKILLLSLLIALAARLFITLSHLASDKFKKLLPHEATRAFVGALLIIALFFLVGNSDFLGLGVLPESQNSLTIPHLFNSNTHSPATAWLWKMAFTIITIAAGFKGGEVTPLFFIGAALGNSLAWFLGAPIDLFAAIGMIAIFASATNTPIASIALGIELLGWNISAPLAIATFLTWKLSGAKSIYPDIKEL